MDMFCFQCQETAKGTGCTRRGVCGKEADLANIQDLLIYTCKGISVYSSKARQMGIENPEANKFIIDSLFMTITNANFDKTDFVNKIRELLLTLVINQITPIIFITMFAPTQKFHITNKYQHFLASGHCNIQSP